MQKTDVQKVDPLRCLELIPSEIRQYTWDTSSIHQSSEILRQTTLTNIFLGSYNLPLSLMCMSLNCGGKQDNLERTYKWRTCKLHPGRPQSTYCIAISRIKPGQMKSRNMKPILHSPNVFQGFTSLTMPKDYIHSYCKTVHPFKMHSYWMVLLQKGLFPCELLVIMACFISRSNLLHFQDIVTLFYINRLIGSMTGRVMGGNNQDESLCRPIW